MITNESILDYLYQHRQTAQTPNVTSSHWDTIGGSAITPTHGGWQATGRGFGNFIADTMPNRIRYMIRNRLAHGLLRTHGCRSDLVTAGRQVAKAQGRLFNYDCIRQVLALHDILQAIPIPQTICIIGDGHGFMGCLIKQIFPTCQIISVNLAKILFFDVYYTMIVFPRQAAILLTDHTDITGYRLPPSLSNDPPVLFLTAEDCQLMEGLNIGLFINIASFQEMEPNVINEYFRLMRTSVAATAYLYCCNRETKTLPDGTQVEFENYPWGDAQVVFQGYPEWYRRFPTTRPPFWHQFDGQMYHKLVRMK